MARKPEHDGSMKYHIPHLFVIWTRCFNMKILPMAVQWNFALGYLPLSRAMKVRLCNAAPESCVTDDISFTPLKLH